MSDSGGVGALSGAAECMPVPRAAFYSTTPARCLRTRPLSLAQTPASPKRLVEANMADEAVTTNLRECALGRVELLLGLEHLEVTCEPLAIAVRRAVDGIRERLHRTVLPCFGLVQLAQRDEGIRDLSERREPRLLVLELCLLPLGDGRPVDPEGAARIEQGSSEYAGDSPNRL